MRIVFGDLQSALWGTVAFPTQMLLISALVSIMLFMAGACYFRGTEHYLADVI